MGFLGFLDFALTYLTGPLLALGYPLFASVRAIETNSNDHMHKLVKYWILYSSITLFELACFKLIQWILLWPYIKLGIICWFLLPQFEGADYCYTSFIKPCFYVNPEELMNRLYKRQKVLVKKDDFLSVVERYVNENGTEALEKLIASKDSRTVCVEENKADAEAEKNEMPQLLKSNGNEFKVGHIDISRVGQPEAKAPVPESSASKATERVVPRKAPSEKVQKEWSCDICQVTTTCEKTLNSHLAGRKHRAKCVELNSNSSKQTTKLKAVGLSNPVTTSNSSNSGSKQLKRWCYYCSVICMTEADFLVHLKGKKHLARVQNRVQEKDVNPTEVEVKDYSAVPYNYDNDFPKLG